MDLHELAAALTALGCPQEKSAAMAAQLDKRARQLAGQKSRSYEEALGHLLELMRQGWAAKENGSGQSPVAMESIKPWERVSSQPVGDFGIFTIRSDRRISPRTRQAHDFFVIDCVNWVNVIAVTPDRRLVMIEQYRHGSNTVELEIPGGMMDAGDGSPEAAALRELREETGYEGENPRLIGQVFPNPAIMSNTCFTVLAENCRCLHPVKLDHAEDLLTRLVPLPEVPALVAEGKVRHSLVVAALYSFELRQRRPSAV
jgi:ADP-ribose pyrophosphatase